MDAVLAVVPYYNKPPERGVIAHFRAVAAATSLPVIVYNIPGRCVINVAPEALAELGEVDNIAAVKQANPDLAETDRLMELSDLAVYAGNDDMLYDVMARGGAGGICVASHVAGPRMAEVARLCRERRPRGRRGRGRRPARALQGAVHHRQPHPGQGGAQPARARGRRLAPPARARHTRRRSRGGRRAQAARSHRRLSPAATPRHEHREKASP